MHPLGGDWISKSFTTHTGTSGKVLSSDQAAMADFGTDFLRDGELDEKSVKIWVKEHSEVAAKNAGSEFGSHLMSVFELRARISRSEI